MKTIQEYRDIVINNIEQSTGQVTPAIPRAYNKIIANGMAGLAMLNQLYIEENKKDIYPQTASEKGLELWGGLVNRPRTEATSSLLECEVTGQDGEQIMNNSTYTDANGTLFYVDDGGVIVGGTATIILRCSVGGIIGNLQAGDELTINTKIIGVSDIATVVITLAYGAEIENIESWREGILSTLQNPLVTGTAQWFRTKALEVEGITDAYPYVSNINPGQVLVYCVAGDNPFGIPTDLQLESVKNNYDAVGNRILWAYDVLPDGDDRIKTFASETVGLTVVIVGLVGINTELRSKIRTALDNYLNNREVYIQGASIINKSRITDNDLISVVYTVIVSYNPELNFYDLFFGVGVNPNVGIYVLDNGERAIIQEVIYE